MFFRSPHQRNTFLVFRSFFNIAKRDSQLQKQTKKYLAGLTVFLGPLAIMEPNRLVVWSINESYHKQNIRCMSVTHVFSERTDQSSRLPNMT